MRTNSAYESDDGRLLVRLVFSDDGSTVNYIKLTNGDGKLFLSPHLIKEGAAILTEISKRPDLLNKDNKVA